MSEIIMYLVVFAISLLAVYFGSKIPADSKKKFIDLSDIIKTVAQDAVIAIEQMGENEGLSGKQKKERALQMSKDILKNHGINIEERDETLLDAAIEAAVFLLDKRFDKPKS
jgi:LL-H family phage holin